jgi:5-methylcytosine-specific restriction endonuclease McrA
LVHPIDIESDEELEKYLQREFRAIRPQILKRDNYTCQRCGPSHKYDYRLHVHHMNREDDVRYNRIDNLFS